MKAGRLPLAVALMLSAGTAMAHPGHAGASFGAGFIHPFSGVDHTMAMLAVGLYAARQGGKARWMLPVGFVSAMLAGAGIGAMGVHLPMVETGIAASVLVFGLLLAFMVELPLAVSAPLIGLFAVFHGYAHHAEMGDGSLLTFAAGFVAATSALHAVGYLLGRWMPESGAGRVMKRMIGGVMAGTGLVLLGS